MTTPLAEFSFDSSWTTSVPDDSGSGNAINASGSSLVRTTGHTSGGAWANGGSASAALPSTLGVTSNRTVMGWFSGTFTGVGWALLWNVSSIDSGCWGILFINSKVCIQARNTSGLVRANASVDWDGGPHHVAGVYDGTNVSLYVDGTLNASVALSGGIRTDSDSLQVMLTTESIVIDDARIFGAALSGTEINTYKDTPVTPLSSGNSKGGQFLPFFS